MVSSMDVVPTVLNLFGFESNKVYSGTDVFDPDHKEIVVLKDRSWATPDLYYNSNTNTLIQLNENMSESEVKEQSNLNNDFVYDLFDIGQKILTTDYFRVNE